MSNNTNSKMNKKYNIIYADPPWDYGNTKNLSGEFLGNGR